MTLQRKWDRLLQRTAAPTRALVSAYITGTGISAVTSPPVAMLVDSMPPRDPNDVDDDEEDDEEESEDREPAVIREPDKDE